MGYLDVITLPTAKNHLRIDSGFTADDEAIQRMITSALELIEHNTSHILFARDKTYYKTVDNDRIVVFDYPINHTDTDVTALHYSLRHEYVSDTITLNVGYSLPEDVPSPLIDAALMMLEDWYFESETEGRKFTISDQVNRILFNYKRCIVS